jgi:hypothetical protein
VPSGESSLARGEPAPPRLPHATSDLHASGTFESTLALVYTGFEFAALGRLVGSEAVNAASGYEQARAETFGCYRSASGDHATTS